METQVGDQSIIDFLQVEFAKIGLVLGQKVQDLEYQINFFTTAVKKEIKTQYFFGIPFKRKVVTEVAEFQMSPEGVIEMNVTLKDYVTPLGEILKRLEKDLGVSAKLVY